MSDSAPSSRRTTARILGCGGRRPGWKGGRIADLPLFLGTADSSCDS